MLGKYYLETTAAKEHQRTELRSLKSLRFASMRSNTFEPCELTTSLISLTSTWLDPARLCGDDQMIFFLSADNC